MIHRGFVFCAKPSPNGILIGLPRADLRHCVGSQMVRRVTSAAPPARRRHPLAPPASETAARATRAWQWLVGWFRPGRWMFRRPLRRPRWFHRFLVGTATCRIVASYTGRDCATGETNVSRIGRGVM